MPTGKIKVLHIIARFNIGGTARYLGQLLPCLDGEKFESLLVVGGVQRGEVEDSKLLDLNFVRVEHLGRRISLLSDLCSYFAIRQVIKKFKPDIIHTHTFKAGFLGRVSHFNIPKIHTYHGHLLTDPEFSKFAKRIVVQTERLLAKITSILVGTGEQVVKDLIEVRIGKEEQFISIPGHTLHMELLNREESRQRLGIHEDFTVLWMGRVAPVKNPALLLEIANKLPHITFLMAGDGVLLERIRLTAPTNVKILGFVNPSKVLTAADIFLSTSLNEGLPFSISEAQYAGLPVVAVNVGALPEMITEGKNGYLVPPSADVIVARLEELYSDRDLVEKLSDAAREIFTNRNSGESLSTKHEKIYLQILDVS